MEMVYQLTENKITKSIENALWKRIESSTHSNWYYSVVTYSEWLQDFDKERFDFSYLPAVKKTHRLLRRMLKEAFRVEHICMFPERHSPDKEHYYQQFDIPHRGGNYLSQELQLGDIKHKGRFHTNILISTIDDEKIRQPNAKTKRLFNRRSHSHIPISQTHYTTLENLKIDLINACCRQPEWVCENQDNAVKTQVLKTSNDVKNVLHYCIKECYNNGTDFTEVIDFSNSDFNT